jgi:hypothetical protein
MLLLQVSYICKIQVITHLAVVANCKLGSNRGLYHVNLYIVHWRHVNKYGFGLLKKHMELGISM